MKENIEVKDVQKTEYLDKNGLDMLWAKVKENTRNQVEVERNRAVAKENSITNSLSEFVSKTTTDVQYINSTLGILGGNMISVIDYTADGDPVSLELASTGLEFNGSDISTIELNGSDVNSNNGSRIIIEAHNENPQIALQSNVGSDYAFSDNLTITNKGISTADNNANHVYATDGSIADLTQYAKKSEITAGGNVDDIQVNGVSVVENKIANIKPATKESLGAVKVGDGLNVTDGTISVDSTAIGAGNYIPYESIDDHINYKVYITKPNEGILFDANSESITISRGEIYIKSAVRELSLTPSFIWLQEISDNGNRQTLLFELDENGLRLRGGDNNHVLTSYGSTIDITQYARKTELPTVPTKTSELQNDSEFITKSVYDEKIAALEARIAALEAKHTETA